MEFRHRRACPDRSASALWVGGELRKDKIYKNCCGSAWKHFIEGMGAAHSQKTAKMLDQNTAGFREFPLSLETSTRSEIIGNPEEQYEGNSEKSLRVFRRKKNPKQTNKITNPNKWIKPPKNLQHQNYSAFKGWKKKNRSPLRLFAKLEYNLEKLRHHPFKFAIPRYRQCRFEAAVRSSKRCPAGGIKLIMQGVHIYLLPQKLRHLQGHQSHPCCQQEGIVSRKSGFLQDSPFHGMGEFLSALCTKRFPRQSPKQFMFLISHQPSHSSKLTRTAEAADCSD